MKTQAGRSENPKREEEVKGGRRRLEVELCDLRLKLEGNADLTAKYTYRKRPGRKGAVVREIHDPRRSLNVDGVIAFAEDEKEALAAIQKDVQRLISRRFGEVA